MIPAQTELPGAVTVGLCSLSTTHKSMQVNGKPVSITSAEYLVLRFLMLNAGTLVQRANITAHLYGSEETVKSNVLEVLISRLRKKLEAAGAPDVITTLRSRGYRYEQAQA